MKNLMIKFSFIMLFLTATSFKNKTTSGTVILEVSNVSFGMGGSASITNTDTSITYDLSAIDTFGSIDVPYGNYVLNSATTNSCNNPLLNGVTTSTGSYNFVIDSNNQSFTIYASCY